MNAIGLYYSTDYSKINLEEEQKCKSSIDPQIVDLHINIWKVEKGLLYLTPEIYIDFGIMSSFKIDRLCLYLPFEIDGHRDLGKILNNQKKELCAIFNDELLPEPQKNGCYCKVKYESEDDNIADYFYLYELGDENFDIKPRNENNEKGTYVTLELKGNPDGKESDKCFINEKRYIRFRVKVKNHSDISTTSYISNDLLQAAFSKSDYYDIRVNEKREIPDKVKEFMQNKNFLICKFNKIHLFYMADSREKIENESSLKCDSRLLECCHWDKYEPKTGIINPIFIAHHWKRRIEKGQCEKSEDDKNKKKESISSFSVFFSTVYPKTNWSRLLCYIFIVIFLSWCGSMLSFKFSDLNFSLSDSDYYSICAGIILLIFLFILGHILSIRFTIESFKIKRKR